MKSLLVKLLRSSFIKYAIVGCLGLVVDLGLFYLLHEVLDVNYLISNIVSSSLAVLHNFILNSFITFKVRDKLVQRFVSFYLVALIGMGVSSGILALMIDVLMLHSMFSKAVSVFIVAILQYFINKKWTFGEKKVFTLIQRSSKKD